MSDPGRREREIETVARVWAKAFGYDEDWEREEVYNRAFWCRIAADSLDALDAERARTPEIEPRCPECGNSPVGAAPPYIVNHEPGCSRNPKTALKRIAEEPGSASLKAMIAQQALDARCGAMFGSAWHLRTCQLPAGHPGAHVGPLDKSPETGKTS